MYKIRLIRIKAKSFDPGWIRTCNLRIRSPLDHEATISINVDPLYKHPSPYWDGIMRRLAKLTEFNREKRYWPLVYDGPFLDCSGFKRETKKCPSHLYKRQNVSTTVGFIPIRWWQSLLILSGIQSTNELRRGLSKQRALCYFSRGIYLHTPSFISCFPEPFWTCWRSVCLVLRSKNSYKRTTPLDIACKWLIQLFSKRIPVYVELKLGVCFLTGSRYTPFQSAVLSAPSHKFPSYRDCSRLSCLSKIGCDPIAHCIQFWHCPRCSSGEVISQRRQSWIIVLNLTQKKALCPTRRSREGDWQAVFANYERLFSKWRQFCLHSNVTCKRLKLTRTSKREIWVYKLMRLKRRIWLGKNNGSTGSYSE